MLQRPTSPPSLAPIASSIHHQAFDLANLLLARRMVGAFAESAATKYAIHRTLNFAARVGLEALFDDLGLDPRWTAQRLDATSMIFDAAGAFVTASGHHKLDYCSFTFEIWAVGIDQAQQVREAILAHVGPVLIREPMISIEWYFAAGGGELRSVRIEELADDQLHDEAYPYLDRGVAHFITSYLDAPETVLVLQGSPGTGKTRLVRAILGAISRRKGQNANVLYTGDTRALESDQLFVHFITGEGDAFVVEDADHLLQPRTDGNDNLHRFLAIADGIVRAQGRKIIFTTNLPNVGDLDDALVRPGRCFARVTTRRLSSREAQTMAVALARNAEEQEPLRRIVSEAIEQGNGSLSLAEIFKLVRDLRTANIDTMAA